MSASKSRKCYVCGLGGHISSECPTPNAKKTEAGAAPKARAENLSTQPEILTDTSSPSTLTPPTPAPAPNTSRKCYQCGQTGHMSAACPSKKSDSSNNNVADSNSTSKSSDSNQSKNRADSATQPTTTVSAVTSRKCYGCGLTGHLSSACPSKTTPPSSSVANGNSSSSNTASNNSSEAADAKKCRNCGVKGHIEANCPLNVKPAKCDKCNKSHKSIVCPKQEPVSSNLSTATPTSPTTATTTAAAKTRKCYNCGLVGHMSSACPKPQDKRKGGTVSDSSSSSSSSSAVISSDNNSNNQIGDASSPLKPPIQDADTEKRCQMCKETGHVARHCPNKDERQACYNCGSKEHFAKECPEAKKPDERTCHECGEVGHITRACPSRKRFRKKDSGKENCFICEDSGHMAKDCPSLEELKRSFAVFLENYQNKTPVELAECVRLLELCAKAMELNGALFVYNYLLENKIALTEQIYDLLFHIYSRIGLAHSVLPALPKTGLAGEWPRDQLRRIIKSRKVGSLCAAAGEHLPMVLQFLETNPRGAFENVFKLATFVARGCQLGNKQARTAVLLLHSQGALAGAGVTFKKSRPKQQVDEEELLRTALQKEFPDKQEKWDEWLSVLQAQDLVTLRDLRELDVKDLDSLPVSAALRSGLRRLQAKPAPIKTLAKRKSVGTPSEGAVEQGTLPARKSKKKKQKKQT